MINNIVKSSLIGNYYPMYLKNDGPISGYLYQVVTPCLNNELKPIITLEKVAEITQKGDFSAKSNTEMMSSDILAYLNGKNREGMLGYLKELIGKDIIDRGDDEFPGILMEEDNIVQRTIIINLRDALRWKHYKLTPGFKVDVLWDKKNFAVCRIEESENGVKLIPEALYDLKDIGRQWPKDYDFNRYNPQEFTGKYRASELNRAIKKMEWMSFERRPVA